MRESRRIFLALAVCDLLALSLAFGCEVLVNLFSDRDLIPVKQLVPFLILLPAWFAAAQAAGLYALPARRVDFSLADEIGPVFLISTAWVWLIVLLGSALFSGITEIRAPAVLWIAAVVLVLLARGIGRLLLRRSGALDQRVLVFGEAEEAGLILRRLDRQQSTGLVPAGVLSLGSGADELTPIHDGREQESIHFERAAGERDWMDLLDQAVSATGAGRVIVASRGLDSAAQLGLIDAASARGIALDSVAGGPDTLIPVESIYRLEGQPIVSLRLGRSNSVALAIKRGLDVVSALVLLLVASPLLIAVGLAVRLGSPGPAIFRQLREGSAEGHFEMLKFRTMTEGAEAGHRELAGGNDRILVKRSDDPRITPLGRYLRRWSIDELPQLWNVLRGEMSIVGPRPLPLDEAKLVKGRFYARSEMRPGLTGPWQVYGRSDIPHEDMLRLDYAYVTSWSLREDLRLLIGTVSAVFGGRGAR